MASDQNRRLVNALDDDDPDVAAFLAAAAAFGHPKSAEVKALLKSGTVDPLHAGARVRHVTSGVVTVEGSDGPTHAHGS